MNLFVRSLSWDTTSDQLKELFSQFGTVTEATVIMDRETGRSKGFGFVELEDTAAKEAIQKLDGVDFMGRKIFVVEARPKEGRR